MPRDTGTHKETLEAHPNLPFSAKGTLDRPASTGGLSTGLAQFGPRSSGQVVFQSSSRWAPLTSRVDGPNKSIRSFATENT